MPQRDYDSGEAGAKGIGGIKAGWFGMWGGMVLFAGFFGLCLWLYGGFSVMGVVNQNIENIIRNDFGRHLILFQGKILAAYLFVGGALGIIFGLVGGGFLKPDKRIGRGRCFLAGFLGAFTVHILALLYALGNVPGLYSPWFHETGYPLAAVQGLATTILVPPITKGLLVLLFLAALLTIFKRIHKKGGPVIFAVIIVTMVAFCVWDKAKGVQPLPTDKSRPNVLLLAADSIRPDSLGLNTYSKQTSPNIDKLGREGIYFTNAFCALPRTFPSWASILTGQAPHTHGIRGMFPDPEDTDLKDSVAKVFLAKGYRTGVFSDYAGDVFPRMKAGFEKVSAPDFLFTTLIETNALRLHFLLLPYLDNKYAREIFPILDAFEDLNDPELITDRLLEYLDKGTGKPFFAVAFYSPTHFPFSVRYPYYKKFTDRNYNGRYKYRKPVELKTSDISMEDVEHIRNLFDGGVFAFDREVGRIVTAQKARKALDSTIIIVTSDHGENLYENLDDIGHGDHFRGNKTITVPLIIHWPKGIGGAIGDRTKNGPISAMVSHIDLTPTLYNAFGFEAPGEIDGYDLSEIITGKVKSLRKRVFLESGLWFTFVSPEYFEGRRIDYPDISVMGKYDPETKRITLDPKYKDIVNIAKHRMVFDGRHKLISMPTSRGVKYECYDLKEDPFETSNLLETIYPSLECEQNRDALLDWMASGENVEVLNGFALPEK